MSDVICPHGNQKRGCVLCKNPRDPNEPPYSIGKLEDGSEVIFFEGKAAKFDDLIKQLNMLDMKNRDYVRRLLEIQRWCT